MATDNPRVIRAFCFKCRQERDIKNIREVTMKNGGTGQSGNCCHCDTRVFRVGKR